MTLFILLSVFALSVLAFGYLWIDQYEDFEELKEQKKTKRVRRPRK
jgi:Tfp pilus assembly protein PilO